MPLTIPRSFSRLVIRHAPMPAHHGTRTSSPCYFVMMIGADGQRRVKGQAHEIQSSHSSRQHPFGAWGQGDPPFLQTRSMGQPMLMSTKSICTSALSTSAHRVIWSACPPAICRDKHHTRPPFERPA
jgi:hypothetical protein